MAERSTLIEAVMDALADCGGVWCPEHSKRDRRRLAELAVDAVLQAGHNASKGSAKPAQTPTQSARSDRLDQEEHDGGRAR